MILLTLSIALNGGRMPLELSTMNLPGISPGFSWKGNACFLRLLALKMAAAVV